jgi:tRNA C32,U32 (ribose-2'-O)-methylase TrmJ
VDTLEEALADVARAVGFSARVRGGRKRRDWRAAASELAELGDDAAERLALVFGNEATGLTSEETDRCHELVHVRTSAEHTSLNLAMAVSIALAGLYSGRAVHRREPGGSLLDGAGREFLKARLLEVLAEGVCRTPAARRDVAAMIERVFSRAPLENRDARAWHLVLKTLGSELRPDSLGLALHEKGGRRRKALDRRAGEGRPPEARDAEVRDSAGRDPEDDT